MQKPGYLSLTSPNIYPKCFGLRSDTSHNICFFHRLTYRLLFIGPICYHSWWFLSGSLSLTFSSHLYCGAVDYKLVLCRYCIIYPFPFDFWHLGLYTFDTKLPHLSHLYIIQYQVVGFLLIFTFYFPSVSMICNIAHLLFFPWKTRSIVSHITSMYMLWLVHMSTFISGVRRTFPDLDPVLVSYVCFRVHSLLNSIVTITFILVVMFTIFIY